MIAPPYEKKNSVSTGKDSSDIDNILSFLSGIHGAATRNGMANVLNTIETAFGQGVINHAEKISLNDQFIAGLGYDSLIEKLDPYQQLTLFEESNKRMLLNREKAECPICLSMFQSDGGDYCPHVLPCGHSLCKQCLHTISRQAISMQICPIDRTPININPKKLPINFSLVKMLPPILRYKADTSSGGSSAAAAKATTQRDNSALLQQLPVYPPPPPISVPVHVASGRGVPHSSREARARRRPTPSNNPFSPDVAAPLRPQNPFAPSVNGSFATGPFTNVQNNFGDLSVFPSAQQQTSSSLGPATANISNSRNPFGLPLGFASSNPFSSSVGYSNSNLISNNNNPFAASQEATSSNHPFPTSVCSATGNNARTIHNNPFTVSQGSAFTNTFSVPISSVSSNVSFCNNNPFGFAQGAASSHPFSSSVDSARSHAEFNSNNNPFSVSQGVASSNPFSFSFGSGSNAALSIASSNNPFAVSGGVAFSNPFMFSPGSSTGSGAALSIATPGTSDNNNNNPFVLPLPPSPPPTSSNDPSLIPLPPSPSPSPSLSLLAAT